MNTPPIMPTPELITLSRRILENHERRTYPLEPDERTALATFVQKSATKQVIAPEVLQQIDFIVRQYKQHLLAMAHK